MRAAALLVAAVLASPVAAGAMAYSLGGDAFYLYDASHAAWGASAEGLFEPADLAGLSRGLAARRFGLAVRYNRIVADGVGHIEGAELSLRRYLLERGPRRWFVAGGFGQHGLWWSAGGEHASRWTATLEAGLEWRLGERWLLQALFVNRALEYSGGSFTGSGLLITFGARFDT
ncbi:MAG: hypothetical protein JW819_11810 [Candidatus Krumholzibacteriota bacterium]|nr:hypothetical protein [Candidatus Krumholzibacteriota bacterium]